MKINDKGNIELDIYEVFNGLSEEDKRTFVKTCCISDTVIKWVSDWILGRDENGWWTTEHSLRENLLAEIEQKQLETPVTKYNWTLIKNAAEQLKFWESQKHIYWELYHHPDRYNTTISQFLEESSMKEECEFYTKRADAKIQEVIDIVRNAISK